ncbi:MAG: acetyl-CoA carboxylase biotin carboxyl carrier protein subunit [Chloroflexi bacterium]|nr:acetyl-CoA carboxylase biotin carboxyl carrier protein subunit [Chloroflexota bacterium]
MNYTTTVGDHTFEIEIDEHGQVIVDGEPTPVDLRAIIEDEAFSLLVGENSYEVIAERQEDVWFMLVDGERHEVLVEDERAKKLAKMGGKSRGPAGEVQITAPMPGLVVKVLVEAGEPIASGAGVLILEAMKMENELRAPWDGIVKEIRCEGGQTVDQGQVLAVLGAATEEEAEE